MTLESLADAAPHDHEDSPSWPTHFPRTWCSATVPRQAASRNSRWGSAHLRMWWPTA